MEMNSVQSIAPLNAGGLAPRLEAVGPLVRRTATEKLTAREFQVLRLMADGLSTKEIAGELTVTFKTAASHRSRILSKLGVHETISAVRWAIRNGFVEA